MLKYFVAPCSWNSVQAQAVFFGVNLGQQLALKGFKFGKVELAFKNRFLYPLPNALADPCHAAQAAAPFFGLGADVITNKHKHG